jgi:HEAT repeat protein
MIPTIPGLAITLLLISALVSALLALSVVGRRTYRIQTARRKLAREKRVRPLLIDILDGNGNFVLGRRDRATLVLLAANMAGKIRGDSRKVLTNWLTEEGFARACLKKMKSPFTLTRARALDRFAPMADHAPRSIERMLDDKDQGVRNLAARIAGLSAAVALAPALLRRVEGPRPIPARIISMAVLRSAPSTIFDFGDTLVDRHDRVRALAIDLAGQLSLVDARNAIEAGLRSDSAAVRAASLRSINRIGSPSSLPALERMDTYSPQEYSSRLAAIHELRGA